MQVKDIIVIGDAKVLGTIYTRDGKALTSVGNQALAGTLRLSPTTGNWTEGILINDSTNGWTTLRLGGNRFEGTDANCWSMHTYQQNFYLAHNGSSDSSTGILCSDANGNWTIKNSIRVGAAQAPSSSILRNSKLVPVETNPTVNGEICWTYA